MLDPDDDVLFTVKVPLPTEVTLPKTLVKGSAPPPNPPPPPPPNGLPEPALGRVHPVDVGLEIDTVRAEAGPDEAEAPSTWAQSPTARSDAFTVTVCSNVVDDDQSTVTEPPVRASWTIMDDEFTDETDPDARGRPWAAGFAAAAGSFEDVAFELHASSTNGPAPTSAIISATLMPLRALAREPFSMVLYSWSVAALTSDEMFSDSPVRIL